MTRLRLFDVDATLVVTGGAGIRAMAAVFAEMFGIDDGFAGIPVAGRTDPAILADALARAGLGRHLRCGAFGDDALERPALVPIARARAVALGSGEIDDDRVFVIG